MEICRSPGPTLCSLGTKPPALAEVLPEPHVGIEALFYRPYHPGTEATKRANRFGIQFKQCKFWSLPAGPDFKQQLTETAIVSAQRRHSYNQCNSLHLDTRSLPMHNLNNHFKAICSIIIESCIIMTLPEETEDMGGVCWSLLTKGLLVALATWPQAGLVMIRGGSVWGGVGYFGYSASLAWEHHY